MNMTDERNKYDDPQKAYEQEKRYGGHELGESEEVENARDRAKVEKAVSGSGQKMDGVHPDQLEMDENDRIIEQTRDEA